jgi:hypothetical protein
MRIGPTSLTLVTTRVVSRHLVGRAIQCCLIASLAAAEAAGCAGVRVERVALQVTMLRGGTRDSSFVRADVCAVSY